MKKEYNRALEQYTAPSELGLNGGGFFFQQDNDPKHSSKQCRGYLERKVGAKAQIKAMNSTLINSYGTKWTEIPETSVCYQRRKCGISLKIVGTIYHLKP